MKQQLIKLFSNIYWFFKRFTKNGRQDYILHKAFKGIQVSKRNGLLTRLNIIDSAKKLLQPKKIINFHKGKSITKSKTSNHKLVKTVTEKHKDELKERGLKITNKGKFKHA